MKNYDVFLSYNWDVKVQVKNLYKELKNQNMSVWMDEFEMGQHRLVDELSKAIHDSTVFVSCITKKYCDSENCKDEVDYAKNLKKPMVILMFERLNIDDLGGVGFIICPKVRFNCYKDPSIFTNWHGNQLFDSILVAIKEHLNEAISLDESKYSSTKVSHMIFNPNKFIIYSIKLKGYFNA